MGQALDETNPEKNNYSQIIAKEGDYIEMTVSRGVLTFSINHEQLAMAFQEERFMQENLIPYVNMQKGDVVKVLPLD